MSAVLLINRLTGEVTEYGSLRKASLGIGKRMDYISQCMRNDLAVAGSDGLVYDVLCDGKLFSSRNLPTRRGEQLCFHCRKACGGCTWSKKFKPIEGWKATPTMIKSTRHGGKKRILIESYKVVECPEYERG